jgi:hypothetical protein
MNPFDPSTINNTLTALAIWGGAFLAGFWLSLVVWTYRDARARARDPLGRIMALLIVAVFFFAGAGGLLDFTSPADHGRRISEHLRRRGDAPGHRG